MSAASVVPWWQLRREDLLARLGTRDSAYVYDLSTVHAKAGDVLGMRAVSRVLYALKANPHPDILRAVYDAGCGFECVSQAEVERAVASVPGLDLGRVLFTPNFAPRAEYAWALDRGFLVTVDNPSILRTWRGLFEGRDIVLRLDAARGRGHHAKVRTGGVDSKFGVPPADFAQLPGSVATAGARVVGLHVHGGSGNFDIDGWIAPARVLAAEAARHAGVRFLNVGGGLGVPESPEQAPVDLAALDEALLAFRADHARYELWLEPGRYLVAEAGVLLARVTQVKGKGSRRYVGVATGMNSLIRPALYGARHEIVNLTRLGAPATQVCTVVGPICESGDELGSDRALPDCSEGDVLLVANTGAYGHTMASNYNLRPPAPELVIPG
jgi:bifunctional diaminopimelate decarboxylase / aspartate kinase